MGLFSFTGKWLQLARRDTVAACFAARDARAPLAARLLGLAVAAYVVSPIDLVPDFIPLIGYVDDLTVVVTGVSVVMRLLPPDLKQESRQRADRFLARVKVGAGASVLVVLGLLALASLAWLQH